MRAPPGGGKGPPPPPEGVSQLGSGPSLTQEGALFFNSALSMIQEKAMNVNAPFASILEESCALAVAQVSGSGSPWLCAGRTGRRDLRGILLDDPRRTALGRCPLSLFPRRRAQGHAGRRAMGMIAVVLALLQRSPHTRLLVFAVGHSMRQDCRQSNANSAGVAYRWDSRQVRSAWHFQTG